MTLPIEPAPAPAHAVHAHDEPGLLALTVWTERRPGQGEDAEPLLIHHRDTAHGLLAVFDGLGGAGSATAWHDGLGEARTSAWVASRLARLGTESWFAGQYEQHRAQDPRVRTLTGHLRWLFRAFEPTARRSKVVGSMRRQLPTTLAALRYAVREDDLECEVMWAGDSRAYLLTPDAGLRAVTRDHTAETDALAQLVQDPQMTNAVCADREFEVESHRRSFTGGRYVLVCATDGFFGYVHTPGDFEHVLLSTLSRAESADAWAHDLATTVAAYTGDDASLAVVALGYRDFTEVRQHMAPRFTELHQWTSAMPDPRDGAAMRRWRAASWDRYREEYEAWMPPLPDAATDSASDSASEEEPRTEGGGK
ncbi:PP2C family protein-serine/threonine phosphatase [Streptomyces murinus]|uniref:PP2C family protein-serine/threonine phosphatase n=1 Tax=Streptomyces murinus TaxID=33900 RepID=UPI0018F6C7E6|nr:protein phosphatase 2C domain-containing protein [Streptomyces murinus]WUD07042.1 protein phosphatase 2C domain-containing protein [Streptomyces murinus]